MAGKNNHVAGKNKGSTFVKLAWLANVLREADEVLTSHAMSNLYLRTSMLLDTALSYKLIISPEPACLSMNAFVGDQIYADGRNHSIPNLIDMFPPHAATVTTRED